MGLTTSKEGQEAEDEMTGTSSTSNVELILAVASVAHEALKAYNSTPAKSTDELQHKLTTQEQEINFLMQSQARSENAQKRRYAQLEAEMRHQKEEYERVVETLRAQLRSTEEQLKHMRTHLNDVMDHPTPTEMRRAMKRLGYSGHCVNIAIAGSSGSGKSSLLNALRGLRNVDEGAAKAGNIETTMEITKYVTTIQGLGVALYDIPGAGTANFNRHGYFKEQGLYIMNAIIIVWNERLLDTDLHLLSHCIRFKVPYFLVRTKCDRDLHDFGADQGIDISAIRSDRTEDDAYKCLTAEKVRLKHITLQEAEKYISDAYKKVNQSQPTSMDLNAQVFLVNKRSLFHWVKLQEEDPLTIDESHFWYSFTSELARQQEKALV